LIVYIFIFISIIANGQQNSELDSIYQGGSQTFYKNIGSRIIYRDQTIVGTLIISWEVENGEIKNITILNSLGRATDKEAIRLIESSEKYWKTKNAKTKFYLPIKFKTAELDFYVDEYPNYYLEEIMVVSYKQTIHRPDNELISEMNENIKAKKYNDAIDILDIVIKRNPLNQQIRETRIFCFNKLQLFAEACDDITFIENELKFLCKYECIKQ